MADDEEEVRNTRIIVEMPKLTLSSMVDPTPTPSRMFGDSPSTDSSPSGRRKRRNPFEESFRRASLQLNPLDFRIPHDAPLETPVIPKIHEWPKFETARNLRERRAVKRPAVVSPADTSSEYPSSLASPVQDAHQRAAGNEERSLRVASVNEVLLEENAMDAIPRNAVTTNLHVLRLPDGRTVPVLPDESISLFPSSKVDESRGDEGRPFSVVSESSNDFESVSRRERNRAAATRSREKRKKEIAALQKRNDALVAENSTLKKENEDLKQKIIALTNCFIPRSTDPKTNSVPQPVAVFMPPPVNVTPNILILNTSGISSSAGNVPILPKS